MKRALSFMLAVIMVLSMIPAVSAAETQLDGLTVNGLTVTQSETKNVMWGELTDTVAKSGSVVPHANGNQIVVVATPGNAAQVWSALTFKNDLGIPATLRFSYTLTNEDYYAEVRDLDGNPVDSSVEMELEAGGSFTIIVISTDPYETTDPAVLTISNLFLSTGGDVTATFAPAQNGSYTVNGEAITSEIAMSAPAGTPYAVSATAAAGYRFFGWYNGTQYISYKAEDNLTISENSTISPVFIKDTVAVFGVGEARFQSLTEADTYAKNGAVKTIVLMNDGILTGEHTISAGNTLLIPYDAANSVHTMATSTAILTNPGSKDEIWENKEWEEPNAYRTLTMAQGAKLTVQGSLNVGGRHSAGPFFTAGAPSGDLGMIQMAEGANITVADGGVIYCWGYIYGDGTVTVKDGGSAHENFQFSDFRGGNATLGLAQKFLVFPLSQYYVQNIEVATTFEYGATEYVWGSLYMTNMVLGTSVKFIGDDNLSMFVPGENGKVTKTYDPKTDRLIIDVDGDGSINPMGLELGGQTIDTATFVLPLNSNMTININSGVTSLNQSLALLPGVELNIAEGATLSLKSREPHMVNGKLVHYTGGNNLIVYDRDLWFDAYKPVFNNGNLVGATPIEAYFVYTNAGVRRLQPVAWSPTRSYTRTEANLVDAKVDINGQLITDGYIYTTVDVDLYKYFYENELLITGGGAAVTSSRGTGKLVMNNGFGSDFITHQAIQTGTEVEFAYIPMVSARLLNEDGSYLDTVGAGKGAKYSYCGECGHWYAGEKNTHSVDIAWIVDKNGEPEVQEVCKGTKPVYDNGTDPVKDGYTFIGWSTTNDNVPEYTAETLPVADTDATYWACFEENAAGLLGDLDLDGEVDANDLTLLARHVGKIEAITNAQALANADVNGDGEVDAEDLTKHARYVGKIISDWTQE